MISLKKKYKLFRILAAFLAVNIFTQAMFPIISYALTSGPSQPEIQSFEPVGTTEMVDLFSGDFTYNIPLFEVPGPNGGYPFNLFYNSGIGMDQEASWTGLGWNLNPGAIVRDMRGLPDEFDGDLVTREFDMRPSTTIGVGAGGNIEVFGGDAQLSLGISIYYNNYKGVGYSLEPGFSTTPAKDGITAGAGLNLSIDSQEGIGGNASLSLTNIGENSMQEFNVGVGYNSRQGLSKVSMGGSLSWEATLENDKNEPGTGNRSINGTSTLSFFSGGYSPQVAIPMRGKNLALQFKYGAAGYGLFGNGYVSGFFHTQNVKDRGTAKTSPAFGYLNYEKGTHHNSHPTFDNSLMDFNREKDGMIRKNSPNLPIPVTTPDIYSVNGQGIGGMFRAYRNDVVTLFDPKVESEFAGGSFGVDLAPGFGPHIGVNVTGNYSTSQSGKWHVGDENDTEFHNVPSRTEVPFENVYFKTYGELSSDLGNEIDFIGKEDAVRACFDKMGSGVNKKFVPNGELMRGKGSEPEPFTYDPGNISSEREPRNLNIQYIDNNQDAGMIATNPDGTRYVYKKVAKVTDHIECQFSCGSLSDVCNPITHIGTKNNKAKYDYSNTDEYYNRTKLPPHPYTYLIEEILGADYIDVTGDGPSIDDFGYWIKFNYTTQPVIYNWRVPYLGAHAIKGLNTTREDNKGSYMYGQKEIYYLTSVESKTHIANFSTSERKDARGASKEIQNNNSDVFGSTSPASMKKLDNIQLFSKDNMVKPIKTVHFKYSYKLCKGLPNNDGTADVGTGGAIVNDDGKLTLESVWFTYENNDRGRLSPYVFDYNHDQPEENPDYFTHKYDRWGNYKPVKHICTEDDHTHGTTDVPDYMVGSELPYVDQFDKNNPDFKTITDKHKAAWSLKEITLPSGALIKVDYEADDYAYVQNKQAMQMFEIASLAPGNSYEEYIKHGRWADGTSRRIYFNLEENTADASQIENYVKGIEKVYFKVFMHVRKDSDDRTDYVTGYADVSGSGMDVSSMNDEGKYTRGWIELGRPRIGTRNGSRSLAFHPFSVAAWQYIRTNQPQLAGFGPFNVDPNSNKQAARDKAKSLASAIPTIIQTFQGFNNYAYDHNWGEKVILDKSFIRLNSPDKKKIGGGARVKQIALYDNWDLATTPDEVGQEAQSVYGQVYDYNMLEGGKWISSGVATYEPMIGGDENPFRNAKEFPEVIPLKTNNNLYFELPVNESYFPGASVGYRKVTVKSLATHYENVTTDQVLPGDRYSFSIPDGIMTTGATTHEFYTAKEFPVVTDETPIDIQPFDLFIPIPLIGQISVNNLTASQGYSITLNDMHGKLRKVSNYKQDKDGKILFDKPISYVEYFYHSEVKEKNPDPANDYYVLNNKVDVLIKVGDGFSKDKRTLGQDYEFFTDMRKSRVHGASGGVKVNVDLVFIGLGFLPLVTAWPSIGSATTEVRTITTNKVIHKFGILKAIEAFKDGSKVRTEHTVYDNMTGEPVVSKVTNNFDDPIYSYTMPAFQVYEGMGHASKNAGLSFGGNLAAENLVNRTYEITLSNTAVLDHLFPGDEYIMDSFKIACVRKIASNKILVAVKHSATGLPATGLGTLNNKNFSLVRSGRRNILTAKAGNITTLGDKTQPNVGNPLPDAAP